MGFDDICALPFPVSVATSLPVWTKENFRLLWCLKFRFWHFELKTVFVWNCLSSITLSIFIIIYFYRLTHWVYFYSSTQYYYLQTHLKSNFQTVMMFKCIIHLEMWTAGHLWRGKSKLASSPITWCLIHKAHLGKFNSLC